MITGTGGSMGRATALTFAREGASVVGCDVIAELAVSEFGRIDVLSNLVTAGREAWTGCAAQRSDRL